MQLPDWTTASKRRISSPHEAIPLHSLQGIESVEGASAQAMIKPSSWWPMYLTPGSLAVFSTILLACLASVQTLLVISNSQRGFPGDDDDLHRLLWSYGPTAILTLISSFWARLEIQTKTTAPWFNMARGNTVASQSLLLDYTSQFQPSSIISALRHKDYTVAAATINSLLIKVLLVIATSLITLSPTRIQHTSVPLSLKSEFIDNPDGMAANDSLAAANFASMMNFNTPMPQGISNTYAYQLVESDILNTPSILNTTVDGFLGGLECEPAHLSTNVFWSKHISREVRITAGSCNFTVRPTAITQGGDHIVGLQSGGCGGSGSQDDQRLAIIVIVLATPSEDIFTITKSNSLICTPTYQILPLDLTAQGPDRLLRPSLGRNSRLLSNVHPWDIMESHLRAVPSDPMSRGSANLSDQTVFFDQCGTLAYQFANKSGTPPTLSQIYDDPKALATFFSNYYQQYSALLVHTSLMRPASISSTGSADGVQDRFLGILPMTFYSTLEQRPWGFSANSLKIAVQRLAANSMTGVLVACSMMSIFIWIIRASTKLILPQNPTTILGLATCLSSSCATVDILRGMGSSGRETLQAVLDGWYYRSCSNQNEGNFTVLAEERLLPNDDLETRPSEHSVFKPMTLKASIRLTVAAILLAIIISLEITLRMSKRNQGLGDVPLDNEVISYFWTALPGAVFSLIGIYFSAADFDTRSLIPFLHLVREAGSTSAIDLDLINKHTFLLLYEELKTRSFEALASTLAVTLTSFLTIFSTGLFTSIAVATDRPAELRVTNATWFNTQGAAADFGIPDYSLSSAALILASNLSYPAFTYENLILPTLEVEETFLSAHANISAVEFSATLLAVRPSFANCRMFNSSQVHIDFTPWSDEILQVRARIDSEECRSGKNWKWNVQSTFGESQFAPEGYFATSAKPWITNDFACSQRLWVWGEWSTSMSQQDELPEVLSVSALACNESVETVEVEALLFGPDLSIKPSHPPIPHQSPVSAVDIQVDSWVTQSSMADLYRGIPDLSTKRADRLFDTFFTLLTTSRYAIPSNMLGNQSDASALVEAIKFQHNIIVAQSIAANLGRFERRHGTPIDNYEIVPGTNDTSSYNVTSSVPSDRLRVVQNEFSTRVLQGLMIGALVCSLVNWYLIRLAGGCGVIPRNPNTIANVAALLADGGLIECLRSVKGRSLDLQGVRNQLGQDAVFRLGWLEVPGREEPVYCIHADGGSRQAFTSQHTDESKGAAIQDDPKR